MEFREGRLLWGGRSKSGDTALAVSLAIAIYPYLLWLQEGQSDNQPETGH